MYQLVTHGVKHKCLSVKPFAFFLSTKEPRNIWWNYHFPLPQTYLFSGCCSQMQALHFKNMQNLDNISAIHLFLNKPKLFQFMVHSLNYSCCICALCEEKLLSNIRFELIRWKQILQQTPRTSRITELLKSADIFLSCCEGLTSAEANTY